MKITKSQISVHFASVHKRGNRIGIDFTPAIPQGPGVYCIVLKGTKKPFYCGEASNLPQRLKFLFRCNPAKNPHPCHNNYFVAYSVEVDPWSFCEKFNVEVISTLGAVGRLEIEEQLKKQHGTNKKIFYKSWKE